MKARRSSWGSPAAVCWSKPVCRRSPLFAKHAAAGRLQVFVWDATAATLPPELVGVQVDAVVAVFVLSAIAPESYPTVVARLAGLLRPGGVFSFFNGMAPYNRFFHEVYCEMARLDLGEVGLSVEYVPQRTGALGDTWLEAECKPYWKFDTYNLPICVMQTPHTQS